MKIPNKIKLGVDEWKVEFDRLEGSENRRASTVPEHRIVKIDPNTNPQQQRAAFIHELLHVAAMYTGGRNRPDDKFNEEEWIERLAPVLTLILEENKHIFNS